MLQYILLVSGGVDQAFGQFIHQLNHLHKVWKPVLSNDIYHRYSTVCPRSSDPIYVVTYDLKWVTSTWTCSIIHRQKSNIWSVSSFDINTVCPRRSDPFYMVTYYKNGSLLLGHTVDGSSWCNAHVRSEKNNLIYIYMFSSTAVLHTCMPYVKLLPGISYHGL